jgi:hypothetical protein
MAITVVSTEAKTWLGLASDVKPITLVIGSHFIETDTGKKWLWTGSAWVADLTYQYYKLSA